jgi:drug/metabolite transporter (DMT)-like permease
MLEGSMGGMAVASQTIGSGLTATFIAVLPLLMALVGLTLCKRPSPMKIVGILIGLGRVIFLMHSRSLSASTTGLLATFGAALALSIGSVQ